MAAHTPMVGASVSGEVRNVEDPCVLDDVETVERIIRVACIRQGATVVGSASHRFQPSGVTAVALLAESHVAIHTWPDLGSYMLDVVTCGRAVDPDAIARDIFVSLGGGLPQFIVTQRGDT